MIRGLSHFTKPTRENLVVVPSGRPTPTTGFPEIGASPIAGWFIYVYFMEHPKSNMDEKQHG